MAKHTRTPNRHCRGQSTPIDCGGNSLILSRLCYLASFNFHFIFFCRFQWPTRELHIALNAIPNLQSSLQPNRRLYPKRKCSKYESRTEYERRWMENVVLESVCIRSLMFKASVLRGAIRRIHLHKHIMYELKWFTKLTGQMCWPRATSAKNTLTHIRFTFQI